MDIDPGTRQPDRDTAPDTMDTSIDANSTTNTQHSREGDPPEQAVKPTTAEDQSVPPIPSEPKDGDDLTKAQEQNGKTPTPAISEDLPCRS